MKWYHWPIRMTLGVVGVILIQSIDECNDRKPIPSHHAEYTQPVVIIPPNDLLPIDLPPLDVEVPEPPPPPPEETSYLPEYVMPEFQFTEFQPLPKFEPAPSIYVPPSHVSYYDIVAEHIEPVDLGALNQSEYDITVGE